MQNRNCDGAHCTSITGEVRRLPLMLTAQLILCKDCFEAEIRFRKHINRKAGMRETYPKWEELEVYNG